MFSASYVPHSVQNMEEAWNVTLLTKYKRQKSLAPSILGASQCACDLSSSHWALERLLKIFLTRFCPGS